MSACGLGPPGGRKRTQEAPRGVARIRAAPREQMALGLFPPPAIIAVTSVAYGSFSDFSVRVARRRAEKCPLCRRRPLESRDGARKSVHSVGGGPKADGRRRTRRGAVSICMSDSDTVNISNKISETNGSVTQEKTPKGWVKFDDETSQTNDPLSEASVPPGTTAAVSASTSQSPASEPAAVLKTETVHVNLERGDRNTEPVTQTTLSKNVEFVNVRQGFTNGDILVTLLPVNTKWPWVTAARFRPELVPEELMAQGLTLTVEEYVHAMELLVNDARFTLYNICYKRVLVCWISLAFLVLLALLFSGLTGLTLFSLGVLWLVLNAAAIFLCMWIKLKLSKGLEQCLGSVNKLLNKHKLILALDDRGKVSCHKVNLCFIYFDSGPCIAHIQQFIDSEEGKTIMQGWEQRLDVSANDIVIQGSQSTRLSRRQERGALLFLRYAGRWGAYAVKNRLNLSSSTPGRHGPKYVCPCQFIEEHLKTKPPAGIAKFFMLPNQNVQLY
ncbi:hypothetical protein NE865_06323 [Phthorimaea operculella]|nr:hypothetical protein NE865_06323 [Phthorimaea operculella]